MKSGGGSKKGSQFERDVCKRLSIWWSKGLGLPESDAIFWRSSQSGGRATQRAKSGKATFGSYGDIAAVDPIGAPLLRQFTIELKCGKSHGHPGDMNDLPLKNIKAHPFSKTLKQAMDAAKLAGSETWLLICKRNHRNAMVYFDPWAFGDNRVCRSRTLAAYSIPIVGHRDSLRVHAVCFDDFLEVVKPEWFE